MVCTTTTVDQYVAHSDRETIIWFQLPYCGDKSVKLANSCIRQVKRYCREKIDAKFKLLHDTINCLIFAITGIKHSFSTILLLGASRIVQSVELVMWVKRKEHYMNVVLSIIGLLKAVQFEHILMNVKVLNTLKKNPNVYNTSLDTVITTSDHCDANINIVKNYV